jgi:Zn-dependent M28 family amino/carboxypeptidase
MNESRVGDGTQASSQSNAEALAESPPRRSVIVAHFTGEEDGLVGARELAKRLPVPKDRIVAMLNLDMIGFGEADEVTVLGVRRNPGLQKVLDRAERLGRTGVRTVVTGKGEELWQRSDHYAFHEIGLPVLFFFEGLPISADENYHTWRDTPDAVDHEKITNTARLVYNTAWILANDDDRPPAPRD